MTKRRITLLLLANTVLGVATTIGVILWPALLGCSGIYRSSSARGSAAWTPYRIHAAFFVSAHSRPTHQCYLINRPVTHHGATVVSDWNPPIHTLLPPIAVQYAYDFWRTDAGPMTCRLIEVHGWPFPAAFSASDLKLPLGAQRMTILATTGYPLPGLAHLRPASMRPVDAVIPRDLLWPGALKNTVISAAAWALLLIPIPWFRTMLRRRRGQCSRCGYDLKGNPTTTCPECGSTA